MHAMRRLMLAILLPFALIAGAGAASQTPCASGADPAGAEFKFRALLQQRQIAVDRMTPKAGVDAMLSFYESSRFEVAPGRGDVLSVTWGPSSTDRESLTFTIVRRLAWLADRSTHRDETWNLSLTFLFKGETPTSAGLQTRECPAPEARAACAETIRALPVYRAIAGRRDGVVEIRFDPAP